MCACRSVAPPGAPLEVLKCCNKTFVPGPDDLERFVEMTNGERLCCVVLVVLLAPLRSHTCARRVFGGAGGSVELMEADSCLTATRWWAGGARQECEAGSWERISICSAPFLAATPGLSACRFLHCHTFIFGEL